MKFLIALIPVPFLFYLFLTSFFKLHKEKTMRYFAAFIVNIFIFFFMVIAETL
jgi:hypothetical protein